MTYYLLFFPIMVFLGLITSYEDWKFSKIRNKWVSAGLGYVCIIYLLSGLAYFFFKNNILPLEFEKYIICFLWNFDKWCLNLVISCVIAYVLWSLKVWGAGDAKIFITYAALIPIGKYSKLYFGYFFPSFLLLITIFVPSTIFVLVESIVMFFKNRNVGSLVSKAFKIDISAFFKIDLIGSIGSLFLVSLIFKITMDKVRSLIPNNFINSNILILILLIIFSKFIGLVRKNVKLVSLVFILVSFCYMLKGGCGLREFITVLGNQLRGAILLVVLFLSLEKGINIFVERNANKQSAFAFWMFLGVLIIWFI